MPLYVPLFTSIYIQMLTLVYWNISSRPQEAQSGSSMTETANINKSRFCNWITSVNSYIVFALLILQPHHGGALCLMLSSAVKILCLGLMLSLNMHNLMLYNQRFGVCFWYTFFSGGTTTSVVPLCQASVGSR